MKWTKTAVLCAIVLFIYKPSLIAQTTICWDTSQSMMERNIEKDISVLEHVFKKNPNQDVQLLVFNIDITEKSYTISNGDWSTLKKDLLSVNYDGATIFSGIAEKIKYENVYVFTDGKINLGSDVLALKPKSFLINSSKDRNIDFLNLTALKTKSRLMDFSAMLPKNDSPSASESQEEPLKGIVYIDNQPLPKVSVSVKGRPDVILTDENGQFTINAQIGDSLLITSTAHNTYKNLKVSSKEETKIFLEANIYSLAEVVLVEERTKKLVTTGLGKIDEDRIGYAVESIGDDDVTSINTTMSTAVQGKFSGVSIARDDDLSQVIMRGGGNSLLSNNYGLIVLDGVPLRQSNSFTGEIVDTSFINPENIADVTVLKGLAATNRFGSLGSNGVILITTKGAAQGNGSKKNENYDSARVRNNIYDGKLNIKDKAIINYVEDLNATSSVEEAYSKYLQHRLNYKTDATYYLDVYDFFRPRNAKIAMTIASNIMEDKKSTYSELRGLFLKASKHKDLKLQHLVTKKLLEDHSNKIQSYYDRAHSLVNSKEYQAAIDVLLSILNGSANYDLDFDGLRERATAELKDLIREYKPVLDLSEVPEAFLKSVTYDARLVFDWNDQNSEFDIQFVNPQNRFFEWEHTNFGNKERIEDELKNGFSSEQFILTGDGIQGKWIVNISYKGKRTNTEKKAPTFIKCRLDYNFGLPNSTYKVYELRLSEKSDKQFWFDFKI